MGLIYATMGEHQAAVERFQEATKLDQYLAVGYALVFLLTCGIDTDGLTKGIFSVEYPISYSQTTIWHTRTLTKLCCTFGGIK